MSDGEYYQAALDEARDSYDQDQEYKEDLGDSLNASYPQQKEQVGLYQMFWRILGMRDSTKVAFASKQEIGNFNLSVRGCQHMQEVCNVLGMEKVGKYFKREGEIVLATTMGRDGSFPELFVSQKKQVTRSRKHSQMTAQKFRLFGKKNNDDEAQ